MNTRSLEVMAFFSLLGCGCGLDAPESSRSSASLVATVEGHELARAELDAQWGIVDALEEELNELAANAGPVMECGADQASVDLQLDEDGILVAQATTCASPAIVQEWLAELEEEAGHQTTAFAASLTNYCYQCARTHNRYACCRCDGRSHGECMTEF